MAGDDANREKEEPSAGNREPVADRRSARRWTGLPADGYRLPATGYGLRSSALRRRGRLRFRRRLLVGLHLDVELDVVADDRSALLDAVVLPDDRQAGFEAG